MLFILTWHRQFLMSYVIALFFPLNTSIFLLEKRFYFTTLANSPYLAQKCITHMIAKEAHNFYYSLYGINWHYMLWKFPEQEILITVILIRHRNIMLTWNRTNVMMVFLPCCTQSLCFCFTKLAQGIYLALIFLYSYGAIWHYIKIIMSFPE